MTPTRKNLTNAFKALRKSGYYARQNFMCCQSCAWAEIPKKRADKVVFFHKQDNEYRKNKMPFHLAWCGNGREICKILKENGVQTEWDGTRRQRIKVVKW